MQAKQLTFEATAGATSQKVAIGAAAAASAAITTSFAVVYVNTDCYFRQGAAPVAIADGTDQFLAGGQMYRIGLTKGNKLSFIRSSADGFAYITPEAG